MRMINKIKFAKVKQYFNDTMINDIENHIKHQFLNSDIRERLSDKEKIGITVGSRGIANLDIIVKSLIRELKAVGKKPFIIPAMGSHGGANSKGQELVLKSYGITEESMGVPILSSMETVKLGVVDTKKIPVFFSKAAMGMDGVIALNRIKAHTDFSGYIESGVSKIMVIGLGKAKGARTIHSLGTYGLRKVIPQAAKLIIEKVAVVQGIGILENGYDQTMKIVFSPPEEILINDNRLLKESKEVMPRLPVDNIDVLISREMGKNISGTGFDTNVIGRLNINGEEGFEAPNITRIVVFDLTEESHGNALGIGLADITTKELIDKIDFKSTYANIVTSTFLNRGKIPIVMVSQQRAVETALKTCWQNDPREIKMIFIKNTLDLENIFISEAVWDEIKNRKTIEICSPWETVDFNKGKMVLEF